MPAVVVQALLDTISLATGLAARRWLEAPAELRAALVGQLADEGVVYADVGGVRWLVARYHQQPAAVVALGPYRRADDPPSAATLLVPDDEARAEALLRAALPGLGRALDDERERLELATQIEVVGRAALAITGELEFDAVLRRIVDLARELAGATYAALGVPGATGELAAFVTSGLSADEEARIGPPPHGRGILGLLLREPRVIRLADLSQHPASAGFPPNHPPMKSFLGVPIVARGRVLGNLYLTEKRTGPEFTAEDARVVELLARHAAVAIENARLYAALEAQQERLRLVVEQLPEAVLVAETDPERLTLANAQASRLLGWQIEPPLSIEAFLAQNQRVETGGAPMAPERVPLLRSLRDGVAQQHAEVRATRPDGAPITFLVNSTPLRDESGRVTASIAVFQDITQIKDAEQLKDDFLSLVSHELRTPLTTIQGGALLLSREWERLDRETQQELLADISTESRRLAILIENMVQLANIRAGRLRMETEPTHVASLVGEAVAAVRQLTSDHAFAVAVEPGLIADADAGRIDQVLRNLLHNAVKYSPAGTTVDVTARRVDDEVEFAVRDRGPGIDAAEFPFVFERFQRSERAAASGAPGMGLGLYLARHVVEAHGGRIWIEQPPHGGTRVVFTAPASEDE